MYVQCFRCLQSQSPKTPRPIREVCTWVWWGLPSSNKVEARSALSSPCWLGLEFSGHYPEILIPWSSQTPPIAEFLAQQPPKSPSTWPVCPYQLPHLQWQDSVAQIHGFDFFEGSRGGVCSGVGVEHIGWAMQYVSELFFRPVWLEVLISSIIALREVRLIS